jgi:hypothetical protein
MTEADWATSTNIWEMVGFLRDRCRSSDRKFRLFGCACVRRVWHLLADQRLREGVEIAEAYADGSAGLSELDIAGKRALKTCEQTTAQLLAERDPLEPEGISWAAYAVCHTLDRSASEAAWWAAQRAAAAVVGHALERARPDIGADLIVIRNSAQEKELCEQARLLRCIAGNPFRPVPTVDPAWLAWDDGLVVRIAAAAYEERAFDRMPILADALVDGGCNQEEMLYHLRSTGPHALGCWVVDLILSKS